MGKIVYLYVGSSVDVKVERGRLIPPPPELKDLGPYHGLK